MTATTGYAAGFEANQTLVSFAQENAYATKPAVAFQAIRLTAETLAVTKKRDRPAELNTTGEVSAAITSQVSAGGDLTVAYSVGTYDPLMAGALNSDFVAPLAVPAVGGDIAMGTIASGVATITSTTSSKFSGIAVGAWVRTTGFTNAVNNFIGKVITNTGTSMTLAVAQGVVTVAETPTGTAATVTRGGNVTNGTSFKSFFVQKRFSSSTFLTFPGSFISTMKLSGGVGSFINGSFTLLSNNALPVTSDSSTGSVVAAPGGVVMDSVSTFGGVFQNGALISSAVDSFDLTMDRTGAANEYQMGTYAAAGVLPGLLMVSGTLKTYFKDLTLYNQFINEQASVIEFLCRDNTGAGYVVSLLRATIMNPKATAAGQNQAVYATFDVEGNPQSSGGTVTIWAL